MMNDKIDVLALMDATIKLAQDGYIPEHHEVVAMESARAAIAELIEAATEMRAEARRLRGDFIPADTLDFFDAALARVGGA
jgi:hypothetical protein